MTTTPASTSPVTSGPVQVSYEDIGGSTIAVVTLNRPEKLNALTLPMLGALADTAKKLSADRDIRAVILEGAGESFCSGLDFGSAMKDPKEIAKTFIPGLDGVNTFQRACWAWRKVPVPVIAAVHGHCYGGGLQLALGADVRVTTPDARWSVLETKWGLIPDMAGMRLLTDAVGQSNTSWLAMTGEEFSGVRAHGLGLATHMGEEMEDVQTVARYLTERLLKRSPDQLAAVKRLVLDSNRSPRATFRRERIEQAILLAKENTKRAREAAFKKTAPVFTRRGTWAGK